MSNWSQIRAVIDNLIEQVINIEPFGQKQLENWREEAHLIVDQFYEAKRDQLIETKRGVLKRDLERLLSKCDHHVNSHSIEQDLSTMQIKINELEHLRLTAHSLKISDHFIVQRNLFPLKHAHRTLHLKTHGGCPIGSNEKHLLVDREGKYLTLLDHHLSIVREIPFTHDGIHGISWSKQLNRFFIVLFKEILLMNEENMHFERCPIVNDIDWWRGTCSEKSLFLSTVEWGSSIYEFDIHSKFELVQQWHSPITCSKDEIICDLKYANHHLAIPISNRVHDTSRIELRDVTTLECIWSVSIHGRCRCCSINGDQWLVLDHDDCQFYHISADGRLLKKDKYEHHQQVEDLIPWGENQLAVLTKKSINLHELS